MRFVIAPLARFRVVKWWRTRCALQLAACRQKRNVFRLSVGKSEGNRSKDLGVGMRITIQIVD